MRRATIAVTVAGTVAAAATPALGGPRPARPKVTVDRVVAVGAVAVAKVRRAVEAIKKPLGRCHTARQGDKPGLFGGPVAATFTITADGVVEQVATSGVDAQVATCVGTELAALAFPAAAGPTTITLAVTFAVPADKIRRRITAMTTAGLATWDHPGQDLAWQLERMRNPPERTLRSGSDGGGSWGGGTASVGAMGPGELRTPPPTPASLDAALGVVLAHGDGLRACIPATAPQASVTLTIDPIGAVIAVEHPGLDQDVGRCLDAAATAMRFAPDTRETRLDVRLDRSNEAATTVGPTRF